MASMKSWDATMTIKSVNPIWSGTSGVRSRRRAPNQAPSTAPTISGGKTKNWWKPLAA